MQYNKMNAIIEGHDCQDKKFAENLTFTMIPPKDNNHYGTGYYMRVERQSGNDLVDVRYERTIDVEILADRYIKNYYGKNAESVAKCFVKEGE